MKSKRRNILVAIVAIGLGLLATTAFLVLTHRQSNHPVQSGMTSAQVTNVLGLPDRIINSQGVYGIDARTAEVWYYDLPLRRQDFDSRYLIVEIDQHGVVVDTMEYSN